MSVPTNIDSVQPHMITFPNPNSEQIGFFGKCEIEIAAGRLVKFCQNRGRWGPHDIGELVDFYRENKWDTNMMFYGLTGKFFDDGDFLSKGAIDYIEFTHAGLIVLPKFIAGCLAKSR